MSIPTLETAAGEGLDRLGDALGLTRSPYETDVVYRERLRTVLPTVTPRGRGTLAEIKDVVQATSNDLTRNLDQVKPVGVRIFTRIEVSIDTGTGIERMQVDGGEPLNRPPKKTKPSVMCDCGHSSAVHLMEKDACGECSCVAVKDQCTGANTCHGSLSWCYKCGDVSEVCNDIDHCDTHKERKREREEMRLPDRRGESEW